MAAPDFVARSFYAEATAPPRPDSWAISRQQFTGVVAFVEGAADFLTCGIGFAAAYGLCASLPYVAPTHEPVPRIAAMCAIFGFVVVFLLIRDGAYRASGGLLQIRETERSIRMPAQAAFLLWIVSLSLGMNLPVFVLLSATCLASIALIFQKRLFFVLVKQLQRKFRQFDRVVIHGSCRRGRNVLSALLESPRLGLRPVAVIDDQLDPSVRAVPAMGYRGRPSIPVHSGPLTPSLLESSGCECLVIATPEMSTRELNDAVRAATQIGSEVAILSGPFNDASEWCEWIEVDGLRFNSAKPSRASRLYSFVKRLGDLALSSILLVLLAPVLILIAVLVRIDSPGPALFVQKRVGLNGELFDMYKFRSMFAGAAKYAPSPTSSRDPRITRVGRLLRRASLDELPQLINVFMGTMSLVGPRPEMPFIVDRYDERQRQRLQVVPGITGPWQLSADRAYPIHANIEYDLYYIRNRTIAMDIAILVHTLFFALRGI